MTTRSALARIHIAKKELALTEEAYRDILRLHFRVESAKDLTEPQASALIELFKAKGWKPSVTRPAKNTKRFIAVKSGPAAKQQRKVLALWHKLGYDMAKLHSRVKRQFKVDRFEWLEDSLSLHILINDLQRRLKMRQNNRA